MAAILYNGESLDFLFTRSLRSSPAYTPDGMDYLGTDHELNVEGVIHGRDQTDAVAEYLRIRHALEQPRRRLLYTVDGKTMLEANEKTDIHGGPFPKVVSLDHVLGTLTFHLSFTIKTRLWGCPGKNPPDFISNRWSEQVTIGSDHLSRITRTGTLVTRSSVFGDSDAARGIVTPPIQRNFNRVESEYTIQSDGMALVYRIVDQEVEAGPPGGAIRIDNADYTEHSPNGALRYGQVRVGLTGRPRGDRKALLGTAILVATRRLQQAGALRADAPVAVTYSLNEQLHKNRVDVMMQALIPSVLARPATPDERKRFMNEFLARGGAFKSIGEADKLGREIAAKIWPKMGDLEGWGSVPAGSNIDNIPDPGLRGTGGLTLLAARLNDPCLKNVLGG